MAKLPAIPDQPLSLELLEQKPKAFSSRILSRLSKNPLFRPKRGKDGIVSDHEMLTVAATLISAADDRIEELEAKSSILNGPMFAAAKATTADNEEGPSNESSWFLRYLTLRNFLSVAVVIIAGLWGFFTYTTSDKNFQLESKQKDVEGLQKETKFWKDQSDTYKTQATNANNDLQKLQGTEDAEHKELLGLRTQVQDLTKAVQKQAAAAEATAATPAPAQPK
jgi:cytoskeletal protein RodZ